MRDFRLLHGKRELQFLMKKYGELFFHGFCLFLCPITLRQHAVLKSSLRVPSHVVVHGSKKTERG
jgi:hypothetical protein